MVRVYIEYTIIQICYYSSIS